MLQAIEELLYNTVSPSGLEEPDMNAYISKTLLYLHHTYVHVYVSQMHVGGSFKGGLCTCTQSFAPPPLDQLIQFLNEGLIMCLVLT